MKENKNLGFLLSRIVVDRTDSHTKDISSLATVKSFKAIVTNYQKDPRLIQHGFKIMKRSIQPLQSIYFPSVLVGDLIFSIVIFGSQAINQVFSKPLVADT